MTTDQLLQLVTQGGVGIAALAVLAKIALRVAERMIAAIDALSKEARDTGKATVDALSKLTERLSRLEGKVEILGAASGLEEWDTNEEHPEGHGRARSPVPR